jgi:pantoate--beta-alanine ligase
MSVCRGAGVDYIFHPSPQEMYAGGFKTYVDVQELGDTLCGLSRQGHFRGVTTVVTKLFNACMPDRAYFGRKDAQQAIIIKRMAEDLNFSVSIKIVPIVREKDGLALSSRNAYLTPEDRRDAVVISRSLALAKRLAADGEHNPGVIVKKMTQLISGCGSAKIEYISIVDIDRLRPVNKISGPCLVAAAVRFGKTRLIDNTIIK